MIVYECLNCEAVCRHPRSPGKLKELFEWAKFCSYKCFIERVKEVQGSHANI
jgi:hypothetical protein